MKIARLGQCARGISGKRWRWSCRHTASPPPPRSAATFLALMPRAARLTVIVRFAENLKDGDRAFHSVEGSKIVTMIYCDQLIQRAAHISQLLNISLTKYVTRKYSIVTKVHKVQHVFLRMKLLSPLCFQHIEWLYEYVKMKKLLLKRHMNPRRRSINDNKEKGILKWTNLMTRILWESNRLCACAVF